MNFTEHAFLFDCAGDALMAIEAIPVDPSSIGVIVVVGGPQYRVGSHRQFVLLARALAESGFATMRFDFRGMGDSAGGARSFEAVANDIQAAIDAFFARHPSIGQVVLWGLCDAASASLMYCEASQDARLAGLCLLNPWVRSEASLAKTHVRHYYRQRLLQREFWLKMLTGRGNPFRQLGGFLRNLAQSRRAPPVKARTFQQRMAQGWRKFSKPVLLILSGNDYTAKEFLQFTRDEAGWRGVLDLPNVRMTTLENADHTFSSAQWRGEVAAITGQWLVSILSHHGVAQFPTVPEKAAS